VRLRHKIEKASAAKQRKQKKLAKKVRAMASWACVTYTADPSQNPEWRSKIKKDPGIPNLFPYKDKILQEIEEQRRLKAEENTRRRELQRAQSKDDAVVEADDALDHDDPEEEIESDVEESMDVVRL
jgi:nuclear GTP-binding protein